MTYKDILKITANLVVIYLAGGLILASIYSQTSPIIYKKAEEEKQNALKNMMPAADEIYFKKDWLWHPYEKHGEYYEARKNGKVIALDVLFFLLSFILSFFL